MKRIIIACVLITGVLISLVSCSKNQSQKEENRFFAASSEQAYFIAEATTDVPGLDAFKFFMPIVSLNQCQNVDNLRLYCNGVQVDLDSVENLKLTEYKANENTDDSTWRYVLKAELYKNYFEKELVIDCVKVLIDDIDYSFNVDITIKYQEIPQNYSLYFYQSGDYLTEDGIVLKCFFQGGTGCIGGKITNISGNICDFSTVVSKGIKDSNGNVLDTDNFIINASEGFYLEITVTDLNSTFVTDALHFSVEYEDSIVEYTTAKNAIYLGNILVRLQNDNFVIN